MAALEELTKYIQDQYADGYLVTILASTLVNEIYVSLANKYLVENIDHDSQFRYTVDRERYNKYKVRYTGYNKYKVRYTGYNKYNVRYTG